ncbi:membrane protein [Stylonychia lemnae]|uniref:Membrane protein n=1 Tax=Stylonychia lemnae TaxID=5949 RepID=A0A078AVU7_STYLE|nr:membrane protein [Stylonychia lemnae]|eukprot:CDW86304.1 membrane protein [Stylonychia lemnae]
MCCVPLLCCAGAAICCAGRACCGCLCAPCSKMGVHSKNFAKIGYVIFQFFWIFVSIALLFSAKKLVDILPHFLQCPDQSGDDSACMGPSAIIRMSFVLMCFHVLVLCIIVTRNQCASIFHDGCWGMKFISVLIFFIITMWIPNSFFEGYTQFARIVSIIFLMLQALIMLVVAYKINEVLVGNYERENTSGLGCSGVIIIVLTAIITAGDITWAIFQYIWYHGCGYNNVIITITLVASISFFVLVFFRTREDASILTSSIVVSYLLYLQWSALASNPNEECNPFQESAVNTTMQIIVGLIFTFFSLIIISSSTKKSDATNLTTQMNQPLIEDEEDNHERVDPVVKKDGTQLNHEDLHAFPISSQTIFFQALLVLASIYYAMLLTNWGNPTLFEDTIDFYESNYTSFWIKLVAQWISMAIYLFSMIAPVIFRNREF